MSAPEMPHGPMCISPPDTVHSSHSSQLPDRREKSSENEIGPTGTAGAGRRVGSGVRVGDGSGGRVGSIVAVAKAVTGSDVRGGTSGAPPTSEHASNARSNPDSTDNEARLRISPPSRVRCHPSRLRVRQGVLHSRDVLGGHDDCGYLHSRAMRTGGKRAGKPATAPTSPAPWMSSGEPPNSAGIEAPGRVGVLHRIGRVPCQP